MKFAQRYLEALIVVGFIMAVVIVASDPGLIWQWRSNGEMCVKCGAVKRNQEKILLGCILLSQSTHTEDTSLTKLRSKYIGPCHHDWVFFYQNSRTMAGGKSFVCGFPYNRHPVGHMPDELANGIEKLPTTQSRILALEAIGSRENLLRWLAAGLLDQLAAVGDNDTFSPTEWWRTNACVFTICTNKADAFTVNQRFVNSDDATIGLAAQDNLGQLNRPGY
jgi:hypothetical protein